MRANRIVRGVVVAAVVVSLASGGSQAGIAVVGGTHDQRDMARWAIQRFEASGLALPSLEIRFHVGRADCRGRLGHYEDGVADLCFSHASQMSSRVLLHEMAHRWLEVHVTGAARERFLALRELTTWNDGGVAWEERGSEQGAEIMAWALGDQGGGILMPSIPDNAYPQMVEAFEVLTGAPFPVLTPRTAWRGWEE